MENSQAFTLFPELALALAGFAGIAATFGGKNRTYDPAEKERLIGLFVISASTIAISVLTIALFSAGLIAATVYFWASCFALLTQIRMVLLFSKVIRFISDPSASTTLKVTVFLFTPIVTSWVLFIGNVIVWQQEWPLIVALTLQLLGGLFLFLRLLTTRN